MVCGTRQMGFIRKGSCKSVHITSDILCRHLLVEGDSPWEKFTLKICYLFLLQNFLVLTQIYLIVVEAYLCCHLVSWKVASRQLCRCLLTWWEVRDLWAKHPRTDYQLLVNRDGEETTETNSKISCTYCRITTYSYVENVYLVRCESHHLWRLSCSLLFSLTHSLTF